MLGLIGTENWENLSLCDTYFGGSSIEISFIIFLQTSRSPAASLATIFNMLLLILAASFLDHNGKRPGIMLEIICSVFLILTNTILA